MTSRSLREWRLLTVLLVVLGLALTAPPGAAVQAGDHFGALIHPIFPHVHTDETGGTFDDAWAQDATHLPLSQEAAPGLAVPQLGSGVHEGIGGIGLPFALAVILVAVKAPVAFGAFRLIGRAVSPPTPPPRVAT